VEDVPATVLIDLDASQIKRVCDCLLIPNAIYFVEP